MQDRLIRVFGSLPTRYGDCAFFDGYANVSEYPDDGDKYTGEVRGSVWMYDDAKRPWYPKEYAIWGASAGRFGSTKIAAYLFDLSGHDAILVRPDVSEGDSILSLYQMFRRHDDDGISWHNDPITKATIRMMELDIDPVHMPPSHLLSAIKTDLKTRWYFNGDGNQNDLFYASRKFLNRNPGCFVNCCEIIEGWLARQLAKDDVDER